MRRKRDTGIGVETTMSLAKWMQTRNHKTAYLWICIGVTGLAGQKMNIQKLIYDLCDLIYI